MLTKRDLVEDAYAEIGLANYVYHLTPGMLEFALRRMDMIAATLDSDGVRFGYPLSQNSDLDEELSIPDVARQALVLNTAIAIAPSRGKTPAPTTVSRAASTLLSLSSWAACMPQNRSMEGFPAGAGNRHDVDGPFLPDVSSDPTTDEDGSPVL